MKGSYRNRKNTIDLLLAFFFIIILFPIYIAIFILVRINLGLPILFKQERLGLKGKYFKIYKFRTMANARECQKNIAFDKDRITAFGRALRKYSVDELPEMFNVIRGEMSLVGPRPLLIQYLERYTLEQKRRLDVKPGVTGWAQVNGRNTISWENKFKLDVWYVDKMSFWLDMKIIAMTVWKVIKREGINQSLHTTMPEFLGRDEEIRKDS